MSESSQLDKLPTVVIAGPLPPAIGGMATVIGNILVSNLTERFCFVPFDTSKTTLEDRSLREACVSKLAQFREWWRVLGPLRGSAITHIHTCSGLSYAFDGIFLLLSRSRGIPVVLHIHGGGFETFLQGLGPLRPIAAWLARRAEKVVVLSEGWRERLAPLLPGASLTVIPNTVPIPDLLAARDQSGTEEVRLLFLGSLCEMKGVADLVEACRGLPPKAVLNIAGNEVEPGFANHLDRLIDEAGLNGRVTLIGPVRGAAKDQLLADHDIFVLPSYVEALPMALLEAMAYGMAIVATSVGAIPSVVNDGEESILVPPGDIPALTSALQQLIANPSRRVELGARARQRCEREYGAAIGARRLAELYEEVLGSHIPNPALTN